MVEKFFLLYRKIFMGRCPKPCQGGHPLGTRFAFGVVIEIYQLEKAIAFSYKVWIKPFQRLVGVRGQSP